ncbi:Nif3-like dinuclear metal center hexameric protein [Clostridium niameyense]|uniref:GTP cyclohydrolase 1 type 2 homolog n=1 Tax=Clostridium niameyense TaxID=1622073 RepID=A0A6M0R6B6_9CLOT|nr:Nif3-like dinuclear metal center hexameric protein [Clostridium niameyense]NEZ45726.1 Nif3-like dinuclear metal center hexameric protein [Clostridium niameyense]
MSLKIKDIQDIMEQYAPLYLKESYDNVGLMVGDSESIVKNILVALDCTLEVIQEAKRRKCNLIVTHHPLLFRKPSSITTDTILGRKIIELIKNDISLYSSHTNLDSTENGLNDIVAKLMGLKNIKIIDDNKLNPKAGIGRIGDLKEEITLSSLCYKVKEILNVSTLRYSGEDNVKIRKIAIINGSGESYFNKAKALGAQCIITGDTTYHHVSDLLEENIPVIDAGHFHTEWPALIKVYEYLKNKIEIKGYNNRIFLSQNSKSPYKYK